MNIDSVINEILPDVIDFRHTLHTLPEIAGKEFKTFPVVIAIICSALIIAGAMLICFI